MSPSPLSLCHSQGKKVSVLPDVRRDHINTCKRDGRKREGWGDGRREPGMIENTVGRPGMKENRGWREDGTLI